MTRARLRPMLGLAGLVLGLACSDASVTGGSLRVEGVEPSSVSARGGARVVVTGRGFAEGARLRIGAVEVAATVTGEGTIEAVAPASVAGRYDVSVEQQGDEAKLAQGLEVRPLELAFAEAPAFSLPMLPGKAETLAATSAGVAVGGAWGAVVLGWKDGALQMTALPGLAEEEGSAPPAVRALASSSDGTSLAACVAGPKPLRWWTRGMEGGLVAAPALESNDACHAIAVAGARSGDPVVIAQWSGAAELPWLAYWRPGGAVTPLGAPDIPGVVESMLAVDLDGDGDDDLALAGRGADGPVALAWARDGARYEDHGAMPSRRDATHAFAALDYDLDGDTDLLAAGAGADALWSNDGHGRFADVAWQHLPFERSEATGAASGDLDRDGIDDLVLAVPAAIDRLFLSGRPAYRDATPALGLEAGLGGRAVVLSDLDHDGALDVVTLRPDGTLRVRFSVDAEPSP